MNDIINPLKQYYRNEKISVKLPSRGKYYPENILTLNEDEELGIFPMTAQDEITLQNPDALLTGQAVIDVIKSCVPAINSPRKLLSCDIDALMIAIRLASYGDKANMEIACPECSHKNVYSLNLETLLNQGESLDDYYEVVLENSLTVFIKPGTFESMVRQQKATFENTKLEEAIINPEMSDEHRMKILARVFEKITKLNFELINESISKIILTNDEGEEVEITNRKHISEWIKNIEKSTVDLIEETILNVNKIGIAKTTPATCTSCDHKWDARIEFNPVNFS